MEIREVIEELSEQLHIWYLEAITSGVAGEEYNPKALKEYKDLSDSQKNIDRYIAHKAFNLLAQKQARIEEQQEEISTLKQQAEEWKSKYMGAIQSIANDELAEENQRLKQQLGRPSASQQRRIELQQNELIEMQEEIESLTKQLSEARKSK